MESLEFERREGTARVDRSAGFPRLLLDPGRVEGDIYAVRRTGTTVSKSASGGIGRACLAWPDPAEVSSPLRIGSRRMLRTTLKKLTGCPLQVMSA